MTIPAFDTSRHNHEMVDPHPEGLPIDFKMAYADGYDIWIGRASVGNYYIDPWFQRDFDAAKETPLICMAYVVPHPELPVQSQVDKFKEALGNRKPDAIVLDMEVHGGKTAAVVTKCMLDFKEAVLPLVDNDPERVLCYTNLSFSDKYLTSTGGMDLIVANPGYQNGMNTGTSPAMPRLWKDYLGWQKDWKHVVPGVPDKTVDYSEFKLTIEEAFERFVGTIPEEPGTDLTLVLEKLDLIIANQQLILKKLDAVPEPTPDPTPNPEPTPDYWVALKVDKTNTRFVASWKTNIVGEKIPVMQIYPSDSSLVKDRIQIFKSSNPKVRVYPDRIKADGTDNYFYRLVDYRGRNGEELYIDAHDCMKTW